MFTSSVTRRSVEESAIGARLEKRLAPPQTRRVSPTNAVIFSAEGSDNVSHAGGQLLGVVDMQEFIRPVRVRVRPEHAGDEELRLREFRAQHRHEGDGAALAHPYHLFSIVLLRSLCECLVQPRRGNGSVPASGGLAVVEGNPG